MRVQHVIKATKLKEEIEGKIDRIEKDQDILAYYSLLNFRYHILIGDFKADYHHPFSEQQTNAFLQYYYHFFKFIYFMEIGNYNEAKPYYEQAKDLLTEIPDEAEKAEFNYRVAVFQYYLAQPVLSTHYATKAQEFFSKQEGYEVKTGACKNLLGMACITLEQFELAEEYLLQAVDIFKKMNEDSIVFKVKHNLGLMYADQGLSEIAIRHLTDVFNEIKYTRPGYFSRTAYLLAREHYKMQRPEKVAYYVEDGLKGCSEEYKHHFTILKAKNDSLPVEELEGIILPAIEYLKEQELWKDVIVYSDDLAKEWYDIGDKEKVSTYFHLNYEARQTFKKKGSLK